MKSPVTSNELGLKPPLQDRSRKSLESLLVASEALLKDDRDFGELSVQEIVDRAGLSVGSFYARFPSKSALLPLLQERAIERSKGSLKKFSAEPRWAGASLRERVIGLVKLMSRTKQVHRGLHRALLDHGLLTEEGAIGVAAEKSRRNISTLGDFLLECRGEIAHSDPRRAVQTVLLFTNTSLNEKVVRTTGPYLAHWKPTRTQLVEELSRAAYAYLTLRSW
jgi:AcrR family transcriptional regulator